MKFFVFFFVAFLALLGSVYAEEDSDVLVLTPDNFDSVVGENEFVLVEFYAPWCGHCKKLAPEYELVATELKGEIPIAKVDADEHRELGQRFGVRGFPTIKFFVNGEPRDYEGGRTKDDIVTWLRKKTGPPATPVTQSGLEAFEAQGQAVVVGFFANTDSTDYANFIETAKKATFEALTFGENVDASNTENSVRVTRNFKLFGDEKQVSTTDFTVSALTDFIQTATTPLVDVISQESYQRSIATDLPVVLVFDSEDSSDLQDVTVPELAKKFQGKAIFLQGTKSAHGSFVSRMGATGEVFPTAVTFMVEAETGQRGAFPFDEEVTFDAGSLETHVAAAVDGTLTKWMKSEPVPESNDEPVKVVVQKTFDELVTGNDKDVLLEFYAPWCGHCKKLAPIYDELAAGFSDVDTLTIAKIDATANGIDSKYGVRGFPTLIFFKGGDKDNFIRYEGDRSLGDLTSFIKKNAGNPIPEGAGPKEEL